MQPPVCDGQGRALSCFRSSRRSWDPAQDAVCAKGQVCMVVVKAWTITFLAILRRFEKLSQAVVLGRK